MRKRWYFIVPAAIVGIVLFMFIGGELVLHLWNWLLPALFGWRADHLLAGDWDSGTVPDSFRAHWRARVSRIGLSRAHVRAVGTDDAGGAREIPARDAWAVWLWAGGWREQGAGGVRPQRHFVRA